MPNKVFIGREHEVSILEKAFNPTGVPSRSILFIAGPSGIGKTTTTIHVLEKLRRNNGILTIYLGLGKPYSSPNEAILDIIKQFKQQTKNYEKTFQTLYNVMDKIINRIKSIQVSGLTIQLANSSRENPLISFQDLISSFVESLENADLKAVIVIDELQNILRFGDWSPWGLMKLLMSLQEDYGNIQFVLVSSDYRFRANIISDTPAEYIDTFYLGEMLRNDALKLLETLLGIGSGERVKNATKDEISEVIDRIGGNPSLIYRLVNHSLKYNSSLLESLNYIRNHLYEDSLRKILVVKSKSKGSWYSVKNVLKKLCTQPVDIYKYNIEVLDYIDWLVEKNTLQYACREYVGIYKWNSSAGGGFCGLSIIAPSNRLYLDAIKRIICKMREGKTFIP